MFTVYNERRRVGDDVEVRGRDLFIHFLFIFSSFLTLICLYYQNQTYHHTKILHCAFKHFFFSLSLHKENETYDRKSNIYFGNRIMIFNSITQHRAKHIDLLLARQLALIKREHAFNLLTHQRLENSIRRMNDQPSKLATPFNQIENKPNGSMESHHQRSSNQKRRLSIGTGSTSSASSRYYLEEFSDDVPTSSQRRRLCTKAQRLPLISRPTERKRVNPNRQWMTNFQPIDLTTEHFPESLPILNDEISKPIREELTPLQRQVRAFLAKLPPNKEIQHGFDGFAAAALYSNRGTIAIR